MTPLLHHTYNINKANVNYINAIARYNKAVRIHQIDSNFLHTTYQCASLPDILSTISADQFSIDCISTDFESTIGIFPLIDNHILSADIPDLSLEILPANVALNCNLISQRGFCYNPEKYSIANLVNNSSNFWNTQSNRASLATTAEIFAAVVAAGKKLLN